MTRGLVIGKFYPPHKGHHYLIDFAAERVDELDVLVCDSPDYRLPADKRAAWLAHVHPNAKVHIIPDIGKDDDSAAWATHTEEFLGYTPDIVFSSEDYGDTYAPLMGATHHKVDKARTHVSISGTRVRSDVLKHWDFLEPVVRAHFAIRIVVLGAESTGTTTLAKALASHYDSPWVPEYGRYYTEALGIDHLWSSQEFSFIAAQQQAWENQLAGQSNGLLICDTNAFATRLWHERYMGAASPEVDAVAREDKVDLYILTGDEIPFVQDGIRDGKDIRHDMHQRFIQELDAQDVPYIITAGSVKARVQAATSAINTIMQRTKTI